MLTIHQVDSVVQNNLFAMKGWKHDRQIQGETILYTVWTNAVSPKLHLGVFRVWKGLDGDARCGWLPLPEITPEQEKLRDFFHLEIIAPMLVKANNKINEQSTAQSTGTKDRTVVEAISAYMKAIETGAPSKDSEKAIYKFLQSVYTSGGNDWQKGWELHHKLTSLSDLEMSIAENMILPNRDSDFEAFILNLPEREALKLLPEYIKRKSKRINAGQVLEPLKPEVKVLPRIPKQGKRLNDWKAAWRKIKGRWRGGDSYKALARLAGFSPETIADIVKAGDAGLLD